MKKYKIVFEWTISHTDEKDCGFRTGTSEYCVSVRNRINAINEIIEIAKHIPEWEFEENGIYLGDYIDNLMSCYHYETGISKILSIEVCKERKK